MGIIGVMHHIFLLLAYLAFACHGRRVQSGAKVFVESLIRSQADGMMSRLQPLREANLSPAESNDALAKLFAMGIAALHPAAAFNSPASARFLMSQISGKVSRELLKIHESSPLPRRFAPRAVIQAKQKANGFEVFVGKLIIAAEETAKVASTAADEWKKSGWEVSKRAGSPIPQIQQAKSAAQNTREPPKELSEPKVMETGPTSDLAPMGLSGYSGLLDQVEKTTSSLLSAQGAVSLEAEFSTFLTKSEGNAFKTNSKGEIVFASRKDLTAMVVEFSYGKLAELAISSRAVVRYINDLEQDLELADEDVVQLRREVDIANRRLSEATAANEDLMTESEQLSSKLSRAQKDLTAQKLAMDRAERAVEEAAEKLLDAAESRTSGEQSNGVGEAMALRLENDLIEAERMAKELASSKALLEENITRMREQEERVSEELYKEAARVRQLEQKAESAEARAEQTARNLAASESQVAALKLQLDQLKRGLDASEAENVEEAEQLTQEIEKRLAGGARNGVDGARAPLSAMKKADLVAECDERKLETDGTVAELRIRLRVERKRDGLVEELVDRGFPHKESRSTLEASAWDLDKAIAKLTST